MRTSTRPRQAVLAAGLAFACATPAWAAVSASTQIGTTSALSAGSTLHSTQSLYPADPVDALPATSRSLRQDTVVTVVPAICLQCGQVIDVQPVDVTPTQTGVGIGVGAVLGGVLGSRIGGGSGRTVAAVAGALGGAYAGSMIEGRQRQQQAWQVRVRFDDGRESTFGYSQQPQWAVGDRLVIEGNSLRRADALTPPAPGAVPRP